MADPAPKRAAASLHRNDYNQNFVGMREYKHCAQEARSPCASRFKSAPPIFKRSDAGMINEALEWSDRQQPSLSFCTQTQSARLNKGRMLKVDRLTQLHGETTEGDEALSLFSDELSAQRYLESVLWPHGVVCPHCGSRERIGKLNGRSTRVGAYKCYVCRKSFSLTHGTIFHASHVPIHKWLQAIYLTYGGTKVVKPSEIQEILNVSFKTAASMINRLKKAAALIKTANR